MFSKSTEERTSQALRLLRAHYTPRAWARTVGYGKVPNSRNENNPNIAKRISFLRSVAFHRA
ncbi:MAG: hypothetical protein AAF549_07815 [Pseudomonadota bacterium]